jgi:hypothetical protein
MIGKNRKGNALLCYFWGESDRPVAVITKTQDELRQALADHVTGDRDDPSVFDYMRTVRDHDFEEDDTLAIDFEIGGIRFTDVFSKEGFAA